MTIVCALMKKHKVLAKNLDSSILVKSNKYKNKCSNLFDICRITKKRSQKV